MSKRLATVDAVDRSSGCCRSDAKAHAREVTAFAPLFKALGDETRLGILALLVAKRDALCVCHIEDHVKELSQPTISHHLRLLREAGLVTSERRGTWVYYALSEGARARIAAFVALLGE